MATTAQLQTPDWLVSTVKSLYDQLHRVEAQHATNNAALIDQDQAANRISDPAVRAQVKAKIAANVKRQAFITSAGRAFHNSLNAARNTLAGALNAVGVDASALTGLAGVGALPLVPIAIGVGIAALAGIALALWNATQVQAKAIANDTNVVNAILSGQVSIPDGLKILDATRASADTNKDVLGLRSLVQDVTPLVALVVAAMLLPPLINSLGSMRRAAA